ncbi:hypothetical protein K9N68_24225 [Kovacikia minuta CCNUW1]|uniref:hypothetical protein n=1 Tax=Kovacikia minuta TaxID=2931930 RepID=UPI001CCBD961|nr:hypothetical protein [Kovacikia minuta]UBF24751.1 hypothetical protein K9N68_24225 [Kovacikia minuta CCNUW1]
MKTQLLNWGLGLSFILSTAPVAFAVEPAPIGENDKVQWSKVVENPFDGKIVYDKNFNDNLVFVSSWSKGGIRATYNRIESRLVGYRTVWHTRTVHRKHRKYEERYPEREPIYQKYRVEQPIKSLQFAINGQIHTYDEGPVSPELATALASAPAGNMLIRIVWRKGGTQDMEIGKGTVQSWKTIFSPSEG